MATMVEQTVQIISNERDTDLYFRLVVRAPAIAPLVQPGQFAHVRVLPMKEALLRRPFSIFQAAGDTFSILYKTVGKGTEAISRMRPGKELSAIGPLGHGFTVPKSGGETPLLVAGGYGMAALYLLAERSPQKASCSWVAGGAWISCAKLNSEPSDGTCGRAPKMAAQVKREW